MKICVLTLMLVLLVQVQAGQENFCVYKDLTKAQISKKESRVVKFEKIKYPDVICGAELVLEFYPQAKDKAANMSVEINNKLVWSGTSNKDKVRVSLSRFWGDELKICFFIAVLTE